MDIFLHTDKQIIFIRIIYLLNLSIEQSFVSVFFQWNPTMWLKHGCHGRAMQQTQMAYFITYYVFNKYHQVSPELEV